MNKLNKVKHFSAVCLLIATLVAPILSVFPPSVKAASPPMEFSVSQGEVTYPVEPIQGTVPAVEFYDYYLSDPFYIQPMAFLWLEPSNLVGVNQEIQGVAFLQPYPPDGNFFDGLTIEIVDPDGGHHDISSVSTADDFIVNNDPSAYYFEFSPNTVGTWSFRLSFPGEDYNDGGTVVYQSCQSLTYPIIVQGVPVELPSPPVAPAGSPPRQFGSGHTVYNELDGSSMYLYEDTTTGDLSLIMHHGQEDPSCPITEISFELMGVPGSAYVALSDDSPSPGELTPELSLDTETGVAYGDWYKDWGESDGGVISGLTGDWQITLGVTLYQAHLPYFLDYWDWSSEVPVELDWNTVAAGLITLSAKVVQSEFLLTQGENSWIVKPIEGQVSAEDFYAYVSPPPMPSGATSYPDGSGHTPYMEFDKNKLYLYRDTTTGKLSLIMHQGAEDPNSPVAFVGCTISGWPLSASWTVLDDIYDPNWPITGGWWIEWFKAAGQSDGGVIGGLENSEWTISFDASCDGVITDYSFQTPTGSIPLDLSVIETTEYPPVTISTYIPETGILQVTTTVDTAPPNNEEWTYSLTYPDGSTDSFSLPAAGGVTSIPDLYPGTYRLAQTHKDGYDTSFIVDDGPPVVGNDVSISFASGDSVSVLFGNTIQKEMDPSFTLIDEGKHVDGLDYILPVNKIIPIQAAWDADAIGDNNHVKIDLVTGKPTQIVVNLQLDPAVLATWGHADLYISGMGTIPLRTVQKSVYDSVSNPTAYDPVLNPNVFILTTPMTPTTGSYTLSGYYTVNDGNTHYSLGSTPVAVKDTLPLGLYYTTLSRPNDYGTETSTAYSEMVTKSNDFIKATFPLNPNTMKADTTWSSRTKVTSGSVPQPNANDPPEKGMSVDCTNVALAAYNAYRKSAIGYRGIGIGPIVAGLPSSDYFAYHGRPNAGGIRFPGVKGVMVLDGCWDAATHELGHTYGLYVPTVDNPLKEEEYQEHGPDGLTASGVSVLAGKWATGYDFMSYCHYKELDGTWVTTSTYNSLFSAMLTNPADPPQVLWASGIIYQDPITGAWTTEVNTNNYKWYNYDQGYTDELDSNGDYALVFLGTGDVPIGNPTRFDASFTMQVDPVFHLGQDINIEGFGTIPINFAPFAFATALPVGTQKVVVYRDMNTKTPKLLTTVSVDNIAKPGFSGFLGLTSGDTFKSGSSIPLKFQLVDPPNYITTATAQAYVAKLDNKGKPGTFAAATSTSVPTKSNLFRYDSTKNQYIYNLDTAKFKPGETWRVRVILDDGSKFEIDLKFK